MATRWSLLEVISKNMCLKMVVMAPTGPPDRPDALPGYNSHCT